MAPEHQVLYTTHSPFMIDPERLERARTVMDVTDEGTKISADVFCVDEETVFPLRAALGYTLGQELFSDEKTLLVENPSDLIFLDLLNADLYERGMPTIDNDWVRVPVEEPEHCARSWHWPRPIRRSWPSSSTPAPGTVGRCDVSSRTNNLRNGSLVILSEITGIPDADIEDLFEPDFYVQLVNRAYAQDLVEAPIAVDDLSLDFARITRRLDLLFATRRIANGRLDRFRPARELLRSQSELMPLLDHATRIRFAALASGSTRCDHGLTRSQSSAARDPASAAVDTRRPDRTGGPRSIDCGSGVA